jgi:aspartyl-tRNA(Asn)/glutamyl-tRNA(Gln) amidotransferase subunit A
VSDPARLSATELVRCYRSRELSPVEATEAALARIERHDGAVNAFCLVDADRALIQARQSAERWARGEPAGGLDGVPVAVKDVFLTRGWPTSKGSRLVDLGQPWTVDAPVVAALRRGGAVLVGKTTTPELGWKGVTDSPLQGVTRNPWDPSRTAGGSSGGSSAAVVLGMAALATGTDGGGSIRIPAGFCGHPGLKPTGGLVPLWPPSPYGSLAHAGPMARTVEDLALMLDVLVQPDPRDWSALPPGGSSYREGLAGSLEGARIAFSPDLGRVPVDPEVAGLLDRAAAAFADLGATVELVHPGFADPLDLYEVLWSSGAAAATQGYGDDRLALMDPGLRRVVEDGRRRSAVDYVEATRRRAELGALMGEFHQEWDLLLTPTLPIPAFEVGRDVPAGWPDPRWPTWTPFTYPFNLTQQPAASVPCGLTATGLPVGLQIVGPRHADVLVLRAAAAYEQARPFDHRPSLLDRS